MTSFQVTTRSMVPIRPSPTTVAAFWKTCCDAHGIDPKTREGVEVGRVIIAVGRDRCTDIQSLVSLAKQLQNPLAVLAVARCEIRTGKPARALARLRPMLVQREYHLYPTLLVQRELAMGQALHALGRTDDAKPHLERVVSLWSSAPDSGEVAAAQRLLR